MKKLLALFGLATVLASLSSAVIVNPGQTLLMPQTNPAVSGTFVASRSDSFTGTNALGDTTITGSISSAVWQETSGTLTFYYQVNNSSASLDGITKFTIDGFGGKVTDVDALNYGGTNLPITVDRQNPASVGFTFANYPILGGAGPLAPGTSSYWLVVHSDATSYGLNSAQLIDGTVASTLAYAPVPEPSSMAVMGLGAVALLRRRKKA